MYMTIALAQIQSQIWSYRYRPEAKNIRLLQFAKERKLLAPSCTENYRNFLKITWKN